MCFSKGGILWRFVIKICLIKRSTEVIRTQWQNLLQDPRIILLLLDKKIFPPLWVYVKQVAPRECYFFLLRAIIWTTLVEVNLMKLHNKYQRLGPSGFRQEDFFAKFSVKNLFLAPVNWTCSGLEPLEQLWKRTYQSSFLWSLVKSNQWFRRRCRLKKLCWHIVYWD